MLRNIHEWVFQKLYRRRRRGKVKDPEATSPKPTSFTSSSKSTAFRVGCCVVFLRRQGLGQNLDRNFQFSAPFLMAVLALLRSSGLRVRLGHWPCHRWSGVDGKTGCCQPLVRMFFCGKKRFDQPLERCCRLPGAFFPSGVAIPQHQVVCRALVDSST